MTALRPRPMSTERRLHRRQHVLHLAEEDAADHRIGPGLRDEVLDQDAVLEQRDLRQVAALPDRHHPLDGLPAGQELGLGEDLRAAAGGVPRVAPALPLGLQPGRPANALHLVRRRVRRAGGRRSGLRQPRFPDVHDGVVRIVLARGFVAGGAATTATAAPVAGRAARSGVTVGVGIVVGVVLGVRCRTPRPGTGRLIRARTAVGVIVRRRRAVARTLVLGCARRCRTPGPGRGDRAGGGGRAIRNRRRCRRRCRRCRYVGRRRCRRRRVGGRCRRRRRVGVGRVRSTSASATRPALVADRPSAGRPRRRLIAVSSPCRCRRHCPALRAARRRTAAAPTGRPGTGGRARLRFGRVRIGFDLVLRLPGTVELSAVELGRRQEQRVDRVPGLPGRIAGDVRRRPARRRLESATAFGARLAQPCPASRRRRAVPRSGPGRRPAAPMPMRC